MPDIGKVIEALEACVLKDPDDSRDCRHCPRCNYGAFITTSCINGVMSDSLALLKEQGQEIEFLKNMQRQMVDGFGMTELGEMVSRAVKLE